MRIKPVVNLHAGLRFCENGQETLPEQELRQQLAPALCRAHVRTDGSVYEEYSPGYQRIIGDFCIRQTDSGFVKEFVLSSEHSRQTKPLCPFYFDENHAIRLDDEQSTIFEDAHPLLDLPTFYKKHGVSNKRGIIRRRPNIEGKVEFLSRYLQRYLESDVWDGLPRNSPTKHLAQLEQLYEFYTKDSFISQVRQQFYG
ncbi:MAG: hypothetical protein ACMXYF_01095 [Candidatus Woesearchaeota archaeon]